MPPEILEKPVQFLIRGDGTLFPAGRVAPDVFAENTPDDELAGVDRELQAAIAEVLKMLKEGLYQYRGKGGSE